MAKIRKDEKGVVIKAKKEITTKRDIDIYRDENGHLEDLIIHNIDIDGYTFKGHSLKGSSFKDVNFNKILGQGLDFSEVKVSNCTFSNSDLRWATFTKAQTETNSFENCNLRELNVIS